MSTQSTAPSPSTVSDAISALRADPPATIARLQGETDPRAGNHLIDMDFKAAWWEGRAVVQCNATPRDPSQSVFFALTSLAILTPEPTPPYALGITWGNPGLPAVCFLMVGSVRQPGLQIRGTAAGYVSTGSASWKPFHYEEIFTIP